MYTRKDLHFAMTHDLFTTIDEHLTRSPGLLESKDELEQSVILSAASLGKFESIERVLQHSSYQVLKMREKQELLRAAVAGGVEYALELYRKGQLTESLRALDRTLLLNRKILNKDDDDYSLFLYIFYMVSSLYLLQKNWPKALEAIRAAIFLSEKISTVSDPDNYSLVFCYNALGKYYALRSDYTEGVTYLKKAYRSCQNFSMNEPCKPTLLQVLKSNLTILTGFALMKEVSFKALESKLETGTLKQSLTEVVIAQKFPIREYPEQNQLLLKFRSRRDLQLKKYPELYEGNLGDREFSQYIEQLNKEGVWTQEHAMEALKISRALNVNLVIIRFDGEAPIILKQVKPDLTLYLGMNGELLYQPLTVSPEVTSHKFFREYVALIPADQFHIQLTTALTAVPPADPKTSSKKKRRYAEVDKTSELTETSHPQRAVRKRSPQGKCRHSRFFKAEKTQLTHSSQALISPEVSAKKGR